MIEIEKLLYEICEDERVFDENFDLIDSGVLDSYVFIELFTWLEDYGIILQPTQINRNLLRTPKTIKTIITDLHFY